jgi:hypothetical protein
MLVSESSIVIPEPAIRNSRADSYRRPIAAGFEASTCGFGTLCSATFRRHRRRSR